MVKAVLGGKERRLEAAARMPKEEEVDPILGLPLWFLSGILGAWIATTKGRSGCGWFLLCSLLGPVGLFIAAVIKKKSRPTG